MRSNNDNNNNNNNEIHDEKKQTDTNDLLLGRRTENDNNNDITSSVMYTSRNNTAPPKMAFLRVDSGKMNINNNNNNNSSSIHNKGSGTNSDGGFGNASNVNDSVLLEDDLTTSLIPQSITQPSSNNNNISILSQFQRPFFRRENIILLRQLIRRSGNYLGYVTLLTMLILVPTVLYSALSNRKLDIAAFHSAKVMIIGTIIMSFRLVYLHLTHWYMPEVQKYVVRILWMVPIYAIQSYLSLRYHHARVYMSTIRDFYEAFVISSFVYYLIELLGGQESLVDLLKQKNNHYGMHKFPLNYILNPWSLQTPEFMLQCKHGVLQYVVFKIIATFITFICEYCGVYGEGNFNWLVAYPYLCFLQNISVMYALYCLVMLFHAINDELRNPIDWHPLGKFLCIKGVVFFTWWQGVLIFYLRDHGIIDSMGSWSSSEVANGLIDYCIVVEMVAFAIAHSFTFSYKEYLPGRFPSEHDNPTLSHHDNNNNNYNNSNGGGDNGDAPSPTDGLIRQKSAYKPPNTLIRPMSFKDALWSSTVPKETLKDIQRLRAGIDSALSESNRPRSLSLQEMNSNIEDDEIVPAPPNGDNLTRAETMHV